MAQAHTRILGTSFVVGEHCVKNDALSKICDTSDEWIRERSGIEQRYYVEEGVSTSELGFRASQKALEDAKVSPQEIDYLVFATMTPDYFFPGCGSIVQAKLGLGNIPALDLRQQCTGFIYGLQICDALVRAGMARRLLFIGAEVHTGFMPWSKKAVEIILGRSHEELPKEERDWNTKFRDRTVLFGDAAGAMVLGPADDPSRGLLGFALHSDGSKVESLYVPSAGMAYRPYVSEVHCREGRHVPVMDGRTVFKMAVSKMPEVVREVCRLAAVTVEDIDLLIAHQANLRINEAVQRSLGLPDSRVYNNIQRYGNTTAATIPIAYDECKRSGRIKPGDLLCFAGLGAGFHWGAALMRE
ncbi:MAG: ketoacyl-ACP synthase III [Myxococcales bacterium]|nr:ketoacyl-ACP synthase III [Myxococcales bacterium]